MCGARSPPLVQHRAGSPECIDWLDQSVMLRRGNGGPDWQPLANFTLYVAHTPLAMENYLKARVAEEGAASRIERATNAASVVPLDEAPSVPYRHIDPTDSRPQRSRVSG